MPGADHSKQASWTAASEGTRGLVLVGLSREEGGGRFLTITLILMLILLPALTLSVGLNPGPSPSLEPNPGPNPSASSWTATRAAWFVITGFQPGWWGSAAAGGGGGGAAGAGVRIGGGP